MARDLYQSARTAYLTCEWFRRDEKAMRADPSSFILHDRPDGTFRARYSNAYTTGSNQVAGVFLFDQNVVTIETRDDVRGIKSGDGVRMDGADWQVVNVQFRETNKRIQHRSPNGTHPSGVTYIQMRK